MSWCFQPLQSGLYLGEFSYRHSFFAPYSGADAGAVRGIFSQVGRRCLPARLGFLVAEICLTSGCRNAFYRAVSGPSWAYNFGPGPSAIDVSDAILYAEIVR